MPRKYFILWKLSYFVFWDGSLIIQPKADLDCNSLCIPGKYLTKDLPQAHTCKPNTWEAKAGKLLRVGGQPVPGLYAYYSKPYFKQKNTMSWVSLLSAEVTGVCALHQSEVIFILTTLTFLSAVRAELCQFLRIKALTTCGWSDGGGACLDLDAFSLLHLWTSQVRAEGTKYYICQGGTQSPKPSL